MAKRKPLEQVIGERIRSYREALGWSQTDLAREVECTDKQVQRWENGHQNAPLATLERVAAALGVRITDLLDGR